MLIDRGIDMKEILENQYLDTLFENNPDAIIFMSIDGHIRTVNKACKLFGYNEEQLIMKHLSLLIISEDVDIAMRAFEKTINNEKLSIDLRMLKADGDVMYTSTAFLSVFAHDEVVGIYAVIKDMTNKRLQMKREQDFQSLFYNHLDAISLITPEGILVDANIATLKLFKATKEQLINQHFTLIVHPDYYEICNNVLQLIGIEDGYFEIILLAMDGTRREGVLTIVPVFDGEILTLETLRGFYAVFKGLTEKRSIKKQIVESENWYRMLIELSPEVIFVERQWEVTFMNDKINDFLKADRNKMITGKSIISFVHPQDRKRVFEYMGVSMSNEAENIKQHVQNFSHGLDDIRFIRFDNSIVKGRISMECIEYEGETVLLGIIHDVTIQKDLEAKLLEVNKKLMSLSLTDQLTGIANRRHHDEKIQTEWIRALVEEAEISMLMIDIDYFKSYNDVYGHQGGDYCLEMVARTILSSVRETDFVARYGGEEFSVILPKTSEDEALQLAYTICKNIERLQIPNHASKYKVVTVSIGIATTVPDKAQDYKKIVKQADMALYKAKNSGRNKFAISVL